MHHHHRPYPIQVPPSTAPSTHDPDRRRSSITFDNRYRYRSNSISQAGSTLLEHISVDGFRQFMAARALGVKVVWLCLFSLTMVVLIYELCKVIKDYRESPITTTFSIRTPDSMRFPQVYICNANSMNRSYLMENLGQLKGVRSVFESVVDARKRRKRERDRSDQTDQSLEATGSDQLDHPSRSINDQSVTDDLIRDFLASDQTIDFPDRESIIDYFDEGSIDSMDSNMRQTVEHLHQVLARSILLHSDHDDVHSDEYLNSRPFSKRSPDRDDQQGQEAYRFLIEAGFNIDQTFLKCRFGSSREFDCKKLIKPILDPNYFLCYVVQVPDNVRQTRAGSGLRLLIDTHLSHYPTKNETEPNKAAGLFVSVSGMFDPTNWLKSIASPGTLTKIDISARNVQLLNLNHDDGRGVVQPCIEDGRELYKIFDTSYSRTSCQMDCMLRAFYEHCRCILLVDKTLIRKEVLESSTFCSFNTSRSCLIPNVTKSQRALAEIDRCRQSCHTPCNEWRYSMRSSSARLHTTQNREWSLDDDAGIPLSDLIDLKISFGRIEYEHLVQSNGKTLAQLVADIGGHLNLWLGASLITLMHITLMIAGFLCYGVCSGFLPQNGGEGRAMTVEMDTRL